MTSRSSATWEKVLAAIEADATRAAALLADEGTAEPSASEPAQPPSPPASAIPGASGATGIPATWRLPVAGEPVTLPDPTQMPPIPAELRERIIALRQRIAELQTELAAAMAQVRAQPRPIRPPEPAVPPGFVDRRL